MPEDPQQELEQHNRKMSVVLLRVQCDSQRAEFYKHPVKHLEQEGDQINSASRRIG